MEKRKIFLVFTLVMITMTIAFAACSADRETTSRRPTPTPTPDSGLMRPPIDSTHNLELEKNRTSTEQITAPRKIPICVKEEKIELRPLGVVGDVMYLGYDDGELMFGSTTAPYYVVSLPYIQGQNYYLSTTTVFKDVVVEETTEILYYN